MFRFWKKASHEQQTSIGRGRFMWNLEFWFWDDAERPGLIDIDKFYELKQAALTETELSRFGMLQISDSIVDRTGRKQTSENDRLFMEQIFSKLNAYLLAIRKNTPEQISNWIVSNLFYEQGHKHVLNEGSRRVCSTMSTALRAYLNCLNYWNIGYSAGDIITVGGRELILILKNDLPIAGIFIDDIQFIQGQPYRFRIKCRQETWHFDIEARQFLIFSPYNEQKTI